MLSYCLKSRKNKESKNSKIVGRSNRRNIFLSKYSVYDSTKSKFIKEQKASELLSSLGIKTPWYRILPVDPLLF